MLRDQRREQPAHDHRIGRIVHDHLIKGQHPQAICNGCGNGRDRIAALALARFAQAGVHFLHESVEVGPAFVGNGQAIVKQVHQHRLAASDAAPQIKPARGRIGFPKQLA